jgi:hypothetical protein
MKQNPVGLLVKEKIMLDKHQREIWNKLCELGGEEVLNLITDYHGLQLLDKGFKEFLEDEGVLY